MSSTPHHVPRWRLALRVLAVVLCAAVPELGHAQGASETSSDADELFRQGKAAFDQGNYAEAERAYRAAWKLRPAFDVAANLGQTEVELGRYREAAEHLSFAIRRVGPSVPVQVREEMRALLERAKKHVATLRVEVEPAGADVLVDGKRVGTSPLDRELFVEPGEHVVEAQLGGYEPARQELSAVKATERELRLMLRPAPEPTAAPGTAEHEASDQLVPASETAAVDPSRSSLIPVLMGGGLTVAGLTAGIGFAVAGGSKRSDRDDRIAALGGQSPCGLGTLFGSECATIQELDSDARTYEAVAVAGFVTAGISVAVTLTYLLWPGEEPVEQESVSLAPAVTPRGARLLLRGTF